MSLKKFKKQIETARSQVAPEELPSEDSGPIPLSNLGEGGPVTNAFQQFSVESGHNILGENPTVYETDENRQARYDRDEGAIRSHIESAYGDMDYDKAYKLWQKRDKKDQKTRDEVASGWRIPVVGRTHDNGGTEIKVTSVTGMTADEARSRGWILAEDKRADDLFKDQVDDAWRRFQEGSTGDRKHDFRFIEGVRNKDRTTAIKDGKGNYLRYNENGEWDPKGKYYLHSVHDKRKSGAVQWVDKALGTDFESWLGSDFAEIHGGALDLVTFGTGSSVLGGDEFTQNVNEQMDKLTNDNWREISTVSNIVTDVVGTAVTGGAWVGVVAARTAAQGIMAESRGMDFDWDRAALGIGASIVASGFGGFAGGFAHGFTMRSLGATGSAVLGGAVQGFTSAAIQQAFTTGTLDAENLLISTAIGGVGGYNQIAGVALNLTNQIYQAYQAGEISQQEYEAKLDEVAREKALAEKVYREKHGDGIRKSFGGSRRQPAASGGIDTSNATNAFLN